MKKSGEGGIRTLGDVAATPVFETGPFGRSGTSPYGFSALRRPLLTPGYDYGYDYPGRPQGSGRSFYQSQAMTGSSSTVAVNSANSRCVCLSAWPTGSLRVVALTPG